MKIPPDDAGKRLTSAVVGLAALFGALMAIVFGFFPYFYAESGSARYAREHRGEQFIGAIVAAALLWIAWKFLRQVMGWKGWLVVVGVLVAIGAAKSYTANGVVPPNVQPIGGGFYADTRVGPVEDDSILHTVYFRNGRRYWNIEGQAADYHFVPPDCLYFHGLHATGYPAMAMCGYRTPVETRDTNVTELELLAQARKQSRYRADWRYRR